MLEHIVVLIETKITTNDKKGTKNCVESITKGNRSNGMPPGGNEKSLLKELFTLSGIPPLARHGFVLFELLELAIFPFPRILEESVFMSQIFLIFLS